MSGPVIVKNHYGQHSDQCFACKLNSLSFQTGQPPKHQHKGDPWAGNPVKERIEELQTQGKKVAAFELSKEGETRRADI